MLSHGHVSCVDFFEDVRVVRFMTAIEFSGRLVIAIGMLGHFRWIIHALYLHTIEELEDTMGRMEVIVYYWGFVSVLSAK